MHRPTEAPEASMSNSRHGRQMLPLLAGAATAFLATFALQLEAHAQQPSLSRGALVVTGFSGVTIPALAAAGADPPTQRLSIPPARSCAFSTYPTRGSRRRRRSSMRVRLSRSRRGSPVRSSASPSTTARDRTAQASGRPRSIWRRRRFMGFRSSFPMPAAFRSASRSASPPRNGWPDNGARRAAGPPASGGSTAPRAP